MQNPCVIAVTSLACVVMACAAAAQEPAPPLAIAAAPSSPPRAEPAAVPVDAGAADASATTRKESASSRSYDAFFSMRMEPYDVRRAFDATFDAMSATATVPLEDAVVLCRVSAVEPAPKPKSAWDRANGRDLMLETVVDDAPAAKFDGPLGAGAFIARADSDLRAEAGGKRVRWVLHDRDQSRAFPYEQSIVLGSIDVPRDAKPPFELSAPTMRVACRAARKAEAAVVLLPKADRALASVEANLAWSPQDPRARFVLSQTLEEAAVQLRIGSAIARSVDMMDAWRPREARLRAIVDAYLAREREWFAHLAPVPAGTWAPLGAKVSVRVGDYVCPAVPKGVDPGSLRDDDHERTACGLALELRSVGAAKLRWNPNVDGPIYACRRMPLDLESLDGPGKIESVCIDGFRQGATWRKSSVELSPTQSTTAVVSTDGLGGVLRVSLDGSSVLLAVPPAP